MLKSNLSTRPFYNDRLVSLGIVLAIIVALALTAFNVTQIRALTNERSVYTAQIDRDREEAARVRAAAAAVQQSVNQQELIRLTASTREANTLIDRRTFSWTSFFETIEKTLPLDARLGGVAPRVERGNIIITITLNAKAHDDIRAFTEALQNTGEFYDVLVTVEQVNDDGSHTATVQTGYLPARRIEQAPATTSGTAKATPPRAGGKERP